ncbi:MAG: FadR/GntR family transcriptional regulator [Beutenbergiaceae bacterium]
MSTFGGRGLHGQLVTALGIRIMRGELLPGSTIDPEQVAREFDVSRTVVREALKVLTAKGLVGARPRLGTFITERSHWQLLDADVMAWRSSDNPDPRLVTELDEVRSLIEPAAARMAAERQTELQLDRIREAWDQLDRSYRISEPNRPDPIAADIEFHRAVLAASGNELLESFGLSLTPAMQARDRLAHRHMTTFDFLDRHRNVFEAIVAADPDLADANMRSLMELSASDSSAALHQDNPDLEG